MTSVKEIESALQELPEERLAEFRAWYAEFDAERWDRQIEQDVDSGKLDVFADDALVDFNEGRCREL